MDRLRGQAEGDGRKSGAPDRTKLRAFLFRSGQWLESETADLTAALHAFLMVDIGSHQSSNEADVELADLDVVFRKIMIDAVLAFDAGKFIAFFSIDDTSGKSGLVHDLDDFGNTFDAGLPDKAWNGRGRHIDTKFEHVLSELARADLRSQPFKKDAGKPRVFFRKAVDAGIGQHLEIAGSASCLARRTSRDETVSFKSVEMLLHRAPADFEADRHLVDRKTRFTI